MNTYVITAIGLLIYLIVAWFIGSIIGIHGRDLWILRGLLFLLGFIGAGMFIWFDRKFRKPAAAAAANQNAGRDLEILLRHAEFQLASSQLGRSAKFETLPVVILLGDSGSAKTTIFTQSGLEPELLGGQVYRDDSVTPTELANCWFSRGTLFIEAGGRLLSDQGNWNRLIRRLRPGKLRLFSRRGPPSRAAIVCVSIENVVQPEATKGLEGLARKLRSRLEEVSDELGVKLPVYVLFTKADQIPFFPEYVRNLSNAEVAQVLGATLPMQPNEGISVWGERETQRLEAAFRQLLFSLCDKRTGFLAREHDPGRLPGIYELPRELGKLRSSIVKFLIDLCRPSQLRTAPFLRGFYFCGVRPVVVDDRAEIPSSQPQEANQDFAGATRIFHAREASPRPQAVRPSSGRRVPQWTFVSHFFNDVLLQDRVALGTSGSSIKTDAFRRAVLASAILVLLIVALGITASYFGNRSLATQVLLASQGVIQSQPENGNLPSQDALTRLDSLRRSLEQLTSYENQGAPWRLRWGLYSGKELYAEARKAYYSRFRQVLFGAVQAQMLDALKRLPATPGPNDEYGVSYDLLKAYLITTSNHESSTKSFLTPVLMKRWSEGRNIDADRTALAQRQFDFYAEDLRQTNPFSSEPDSQAVGQGRRYLSQFAGLESIYQAMLSEAARKNAQVNFNNRYPGSAEVVVVDREVSGAFSKEGWAFMQDAARNADRFFSGERWVLGEQAPTALDRQKLEQQLRARYTADFIAQWRTVVKSASVVRYASIGDGGKKLSRLSSNQSPLLALFSLVSENTAVDSPEVKSAFQAVQFVVPPGNPQQYIGANNSGYMKALLQLQSALEQGAGSAGSAATDPSAIAQINNSAGAAKLTTRELALSFGVDREAHLGEAVQKLMEDPITYAEVLVRNAIPGELNAKGRAMCAPLQNLMTKFPFNPASTQPASIQEMNAVFQPQTGTLWTSYNSDLSKYLVRQGSDYVESPTGGVRLTPAFLSFWNRAAAFSDVVYPANSAQPRLSFSLKPYPTRGIDRITLTIEGRTLNASGTRPSTQQFVWTGAPGQDVKMTVKIGGGAELAFPTYEGPWAVFQFFGDADTSTASGPVYTLEWVFRQGRQGRPVTLPGGSPLTVKFDLEMMGRSAPVFQKGYLSSLRCVSEIARP